MDHARAAAAVGRLCSADLDPRALREQVLRVLRQVVGFDGYAWLLTDPVTWVGAAPLADVAWLPELPRHVRLKYATVVNRWTGLGPAHVATLHAATEGHLDRSLLWRDLLADHGVGDVASAVFVDQHGCWGFLELFRDRARGPFAAADTAFLAAVVAPLATALRTSQARHFPTDRHPGAGPAGPLVLLLSLELQVVGQTPATSAALRQLVPAPPDTPPVPAGAYNVAAQLLALEAGVDHHPATARVHLADGAWVTLRAARVAGPGPAQIAVTLETCSPDERLDLFARVLGLTPRETELVTLLAAGSDTRELARSLLLSQHTVQDHLKSVFAKTGTRSRPALLARALGT